MLEIFRTEHDFCIISYCRNSFNNKLKNYLKKSSRESMNRLLVCAPPSLDSICKYGIYPIDDIGAFIAISNN